MRIYFARHGESQANLLHEISNRGLRHGLTRTGRQQAFTLAQKLRGRAINHIYSSPVLRAIETSIILANELQLDYEVVDALREYDCGVIEGRADDASWKLWRELFDAWTVHKQWERCIEGGESFIDIRNRFVPFIEGLIRQFGKSDEQIVCVSHGGIYRMMLPLVLQNADAEVMTLHGFGYTDCLISEAHAGSLFCAGWNGHIMENRTLEAPRTE